MKKRPQGILDLQKSTQNTKLTENDFLRKCTQKNLFEEKALRETIAREIQCKENYFFQRLEEENNETALILAGQQQKDMQTKQKEKAIILQKQIIERNTAEQNKLREEKRKMQILQNSADFQEFQRKMKASEVTSKQLSQIKSKTVQAVNEKEREISERKNLEHAIKKEMENELYKKIASQNKKKEYQNILLQQIRSQQKHKKQAELASKTAENEALVKIEEEETRNKMCILDETLRKRKAAKEIYEKYLHDFDERQSKEHTQAVAEANRVQQYLRQQQEWHRLQQESRNLHYQMKEDLKENVSQIIQKENEKHFKAMQDKIKKEELESQVKQKCELEMEEQVKNQKRQSMHTSFLQQLKHREEQLYHELAEEERYREKIQAELAKTQLNAPHTCLNKSNYLEELKKMIEEMQQRKVSEMKSDSMFMDKKMQMESEENKLVKIEKQKLLKKSQQLKKILTYLP